MKDTLLKPETPDQLQAESGSRAPLCSVPWVVAESLPEFSYMQRLCEIRYGKTPLSEPPMKYPVAFILEKDCAMWSDRMDRAASYVSFADFIAQNAESIHPDQKPLDYA